MSNGRPIQLSQRVQEIPQALSIYLNQIVYEQRRKGRDIITLSLGEAYFKIPDLPFHPDDIAQGYHYTDSQGIPALRRKIAAFYYNHYGALVDPETELLITAGSKAAIFMAMQALLNPGDEVLIFEPAWLTYQEQARLIEAIPSFIPYDCPIDTFHHHFTARSKLLIINNPNNPAGRLFTREELISIYHQCRSNGIVVLVDEAYSDFVLDTPFHSMADIVPDKDGIILVNSLSKNMGMSGWRVGYIIAAPKLIEAILKLNQHIVTCAPSILQFHMARYFDDIIAATIPQAQHVVKKRRDIVRYLEQAGIHAMAGDGTFYFFISIGDFPDTSLNFALYLLLKYGIAVVPGCAYGRTTERFIRLSIGTESMERIQSALDTICQLIQAESFDWHELSMLMMVEDVKPFLEPYQLPQKGIPAHE